MIGIAGTIWMIWNIASDPATRMSIYTVCGIIAVCLAVYAALWTKKVMRVPLFKPFPLEHVMAMENDEYMPHHIDKETGKFVISKGLNEQNT